MVVSLEEMKQYLRVVFGNEVVGSRKAFCRGIFQNTDCKDRRDVCGGISL